MKLKVIMILAFLSFGSTLDGKCGCSISLIAKLAQDILDGINLIKPKVYSIENLVIENISLSEQIITDISILSENLISQIEQITCSIGDVIITATVDLTPAINTTISVGEVISSEIEQLSETISSNDQIIISLLEQIDNKTFGVSLGCDLCSKLDVLDERVSTNDEILVSLSEQILTNISILSENLISQIEQITCSIGDVIITATVDLTPAINTTISVGEVISSEIEQLSETISSNDQIIISLLEQIDNKTFGVSLGCDLCSKLDVLTIEVSLGDAVINSKIGDLDQSGSCLESLIDVPDDINNLNLTIIQLLKTILLELRGCGGC